MPSYEALKDEYLQMWSDVIVDDVQQVKNVVQVILNHENDYKAVEAKTKVPWYFIACIHSLEGSCNFNTHLHNGDPLSQRTTHVPKGLPKTGNPPFTWVESAIDALTHEGFVGKTDWNIEKLLYRLEIYNGFGYRRRDVNSPYLWSMTDYYDCGKFVADGKFDPDAVSKQVGAVAILKTLQERNIIKL